MYQYTCLPNGLASAPRIFTKLLKPVFNILRQKGYLPLSYIDDCYLKGATYGKCHNNVQETVMLLGDLGFPIHNEKSVLIPSQVLTFLGFVLTMTVQLTKSRKQKLKTASGCLNLVNKETFHNSKCGRGNWGHCVKFSRDGTRSPPLSQPGKGQITCLAREQRQLWILYDPLPQF